ncbi:MAG: precorrin-6A reductase [Lachnospiraceae bacterium]|nr:precorrin-6A reductase [Lachnospiraceae bacterium]
MKEILIFAGTTEGRKLSECLAASGISHTICVATEYGEVVLKEHPLRKVHCGRMHTEEIKEFIEKGSFDAVVDATHPYADVITENIKTAMEGMDIPYLRLKRELDEQHTDGNVRYFLTNEACAKVLEEMEGNILLTTGSKELSKYCVSENVKSRLYVRVLPGIESLSICMKQGIKGKQIIAMQGPFTTEMNEAMIHQYAISCLVTKQSGMSGGYSEKKEAARRAGIPVFVIGRPKEEAGYSFKEICNKLEKISGQKIQINGELQIILAGIGMGHKNSLTKEVKDAIEEADILLGAERMLAPYQPRMEKKPFYQAKQIIPYLKEIQEKKLFLENRKVVILFSGDSGFYSGCQLLYDALQKEINVGRLKASICIMPGISSVAYLASCIGESYQDAAICSMHGKELNNLARRIKTQQKTYVLMSGVKDVNRLGNILTEAGMTECEIMTGFQLSYTEQQIRKLTPRECCELTEEGLYTCFIKNPNAVHKQLTHGITDGEFIRDKVPMTKEEVRDVSICKLKLYEGAVVYDIGSGTGSIAVEIAGLSDGLKIYAIEQKNEALSLIQQNKKKFQLDNISVVEAKAPNGLTELPKATHAFIGGSGGNLKEILQVLYYVNSHMRVVINAISMETICEIKEILSLYPVENEEIVQMQVNRAKKAGQYHLMQAENPVWICAFDFYEQ